MLKHLKRYFYTGLLVWVPVVATFFILTFLLDFFDLIIAWLPKSLQPSQWIGYTIPGLGFFISITLITLTGALAANVVGKMLIKVSDRIFQKIPLVKQIYFGIKKSLQVIFLSSNKSFQEVVLVQYPKEDIWSLAFVTNNANCDDMEMLSLFIPTTPNPTSGFIILVPQDETIKLTCSVEDALKYVISLGTLVSPQEIIPKGLIKPNKSTNDEKIQ